VIAKIRSRAEIKKSDRRINKEFSGNYFSGRFFVHDWNSFIHVAAENAELKKILRKMRPLEKCKTTDKYQAEHLGGYIHNCIENLKTP